MFREKNVYCIHNYKFENYNKNIEFTINKNLDLIRKIILLKFKNNDDFEIEEIDNLTNRVIIKNSNEYIKIYLIMINENNELFYLGNNNIQIEFIDTNCLINAYSEIPLNFITYCTNNKLYALPDEYPNTLYYINNQLSNNCDIFYITYADACNTCRRYMLATESMNLKTIGLKSVKHPFDYPDEMKISKTLEYGAGCDILEQFPTIINIKKNIKMIYGIIASVRYICMHSHTYFLLNNEHVDFKKMNKKLIITVGGAVYRFQKDKCNQFFNKYIDFSISQSSDLYNFGLNNNKLIHYPLDTTYIKPDFSFKNENKLIVGHFPSTSIVKGSKTIIQGIHNVYEKFSDKFNYIGISDPGDDYNKFASHRVSFNDQLKRYKTCDIYIETLNPLQKLNNPAYPHIDQEELFGEWGNTCLEACYSGCIVISNCIFYENYKQTYGIYPGFIIANTQSELEKKLEELVFKSRDELLELKTRCVKWVEDYHSIEKIGEKLYREIYSIEN